MSEIENSRLCQHCKKTFCDPEAVRCPLCLGDLDSPPKAPGVFIDPDTVSNKQLKRIDDFALRIMNKHEYLFDDKIPPGTIFVREALKCEDLDIPQIYDFTGASYEIYRRADRTWAIRIMYNGKSIIEAAYAKM